MLNQPTNLPGDSWPLLDISVFGRSIYLTLISRRSNQFAGTRFLKRGGNASVSARTVYLLTVINAALLWFVVVCWYVWWKYCMMPFANFVHDIVRLDIRTECDMCQFWGSNPLNKPDVDVDVDQWHTVLLFYVSSRFAECCVSFSFHHFNFKFLSLMRYNLFMGVSEMHVKILPLRCQLGLRLGSV